MKNRRIIPLVAAVVILGSLHGLASDVKIVANRSVRPDSITLAELREVFLENNRSLQDGSHVEPVLAKGGGAHDTFLRDYLGKSDDELRTYYRTLVFTGTGAMPKFLASDAEIIQYVAATRGAIGYVSRDFPAEGVKTLVISRQSAKSERQLLTRFEPQYPEALKQRQIGGTVRLELTISPKGAVQSVRLLGGNPVLDEAAVKAVKQWVYSVSPSTTTTEVSIPFEP